MLNRKMLCVLSLAALVTTTGSAQQRGPSEVEKISAKAAWPKDVNRESGQRLPLPKREDMDETGKKVWDELVGNNPPRGPLAVQMYSPRYQWLVRQVNNFLRNEKESGLTPHVQELSILIGTRESNADFEYTAHEAAARKAGIDPKVIDAIRFRRKLEGLPEGDAAIIQLGREIYQTHKVSSETFAVANKIYGPMKLVNIVGLMNFYYSVAGEIHTFGQEMPAGEKSALAIDGR
jgi:4-carboxymuconolactone decarboxylase